MSMATPQQRRQILTLLTLGDRSDGIARALGLNRDVVEQIVSSRYSRGFGDAIERARWLASRRVKVIP